MPRIEDLSSAWPAIDQAQTDDYQHFPRPTWYLDKQGFVVKTNQLAMRLWSPSPVLGSHVIQVMTHPDVWARLPAEENLQFHRHKTIALNTIASMLPPGALDFWIDRVREDADSFEIYSLGVKLSEEAFNRRRAWNYPLYFAPPHPFGRSDPLRFDVTVYRIRNGSGFFTEFNPSDAATESAMQAEFMRLKRSGERYVFRLDDDHPYPLYYPMLFQNFLWRIIWSNDPNSWLVGRPILDENLLELILPLKGYTDDMSVFEQGSSALLAIKWYERQTASYRNQNNRWHDQYEQNRAKLLRNKTLRRVLEKAERVPDRIIDNRPSSNSHLWFNTCSVTPSYPQLPGAQLDFQCWVKAYRGGFEPEEGRDDHLLVLVPENNATKAALVLLTLSRSPYVKTHIGSTAREQIIWGLSITHTLHEAVAPAEIVPSWEPTFTFRSWYDQLHRSCGQEENPTLNRLVRETKQRLSQLFERIETNRRTNLLDIMAQAASSVPAFSLLIAMERDNLTKARPGVEEGDGTDQETEALEREGFVFDAVVPDGIASGQKYITVKSIVESGRTRYTLRHIHALMQEGRIKGYRLGRAWFMDARGLAALLAYEHESLTTKHQGAKPGAELPILRESVARRRRTDTAPTPARASHGSFNAANRQASD